MYDGRIGGAQYYKPGAHGLDNPTRMARDYFLLTVATAAPKVYRDLELLLPLMDKAMEAEIEEWKALKASLAAEGRPVDSHFAPNTLSVTWIYGLFEMANEGYDGPLEDESTPVRELVFALCRWAKMHRLAAWMVKECLEELHRAWRQPDNKQCFGFWIGHPGQMSEYPFRAERVQYRFGMYASPIGEPPTVVDIEERLHATKEGPDAEWVVEDDPHMGFHREFVFRFEGYDPTMMTRKRFQKYIEHAFKGAVQHYAERLEQDLAEDGYKPCPHVRNTKMFEIAVDHFILGLTREEIAAKRKCSLATVDQAFKKVGRWMDYTPEFLPRKEREMKSIGRRIRK